MKVMAIETSCDETGVSVIEANGDFGPDFAFCVLGNALQSQAAIHAPYGGVFPNLAKREHAKNLVPVMAEALEQANILQKGTTLQTEHIKQEILSILEREPGLADRLLEFLQTYARPDIDAIAVTHGPGLEPALWVGVNFVRALSIAWGLPLVAVNHMEGHVIISMMEEGAIAPFEFPLLSLLISGGHTELVLSRGFLQYELIGQTRDDAVGEAFDKVARLLDLPYPGGPQISRLATESRAVGFVTEDRTRSPRSGRQGTCSSVSVGQVIKTNGSTLGVRFTPPMLHSGDYDFSFSGIKTEVRRLVEGLPKPLPQETKRDIARAFENAVAEVLVAKTIRAAEEYGARTVLVGGGVSANTYIRQLLASEAKPREITLLVPPPALATDNALMIALPGYFRSLRDEYTDPKTLRANGNLKLAQLS